MRAAAISRRRRARARSRALPSSKPSGGGGGARPVASSCPMSRCPASVNARLPCEPAATNTASAGAPASRRGRTAGAGARCTRESSSSTAPASAASAAAARGSQALMPPSPSVARDQARCESAVGAMAVAGDALVWYPPASLAALAWVVSEYHESGARFWAVELLRSRLGFLVAARGVRVRAGAVVPVERCWRARRRRQTRASWCCTCSIASRRPLPSAPFEARARPPATSRPRCTPWPRARCTRPG